MSDKIINTFQQRRQLAQELAGLAQTTSEPELLEAVRRLAHGYPSELLVASLVKNLDTGNSQVRGGLGHLAALLPPEEIVPALRGTAANRQLSAQSRVTAALILERFLGETLPPGLMSDLTQTNEVAFQSLREAVEEGQRNRHILLEYVAQMRQAGDVIAFSVMGLLNRLAPAEQAELYRLIAQDDRPPVARSALQRLERLATVDRVPEAVRALHTLQFTLPPDAAAQVERSLRKLAFGGTRYTPPASTGWRGLLSPADAGGSYSVWFVRMPETSAASGVLLGMVANARLGILQAFGSETMQRDQLPRPHAVGQMVTVRTDNGGTAVLLEAGFDFCRWRLLAAQRGHWQAEPAKPLPGDYRLYQDRLWEFDPPRPDPELAHYFAEPDPAEPLPSPAQVDEAASQLLIHPAMSGWVLHNRLFLQAFAPAGRGLDRIPLSGLVAHILAELAQREESAQLLAALAEGLRCQAAWLHMAGNRESARRADLLARALPRLAPLENPFLARLVESSLRAAGLSA